MYERGFFLARHNFLAQVPTVSEFDVNVLVIIWTVIVGGGTMYTKTSKGAIAKKRLRITVVDNYHLDYLVGILLEMTLIISGTPNTVI